MNVLSSISENTPYVLLQRVDAIIQRVKQDLEDKKPVSLQGDFEAYLQQNPLFDHEYLGLLAYAQEIVETREIKEVEIHE